MEFVPHPRIVLLLNPGQQLELRRTQV